MSITVPRSNEFVSQILKAIHSSKLNGGDWKEELPEQQMILKWINPNARVLEIGGNIGRSSICIANIIQQNIGNLVVMESDISIANILEKNRNDRNLCFNIEKCAISNTTLKQKNWDTEPFDINDKLTDNWHLVPIISYENLLKKYKKFDTLVIDCEGAFYYILKDTPEILDNIKMIIIENDFKKEEHETFVFATFVRHGFRVVDQRGIGNWKNYIYQVWMWYEPVF